MPTTTVAGRVFDARPDRIDLRDRVYAPKLASLPDHYPERALVRDWFRTYAKEDLVLDQESEGACTGFGLAAVVNFLLWRDARVSGRPARGRKPRTGQRVSPRMLYHLARLYDEWPGEDYEGSSCRGAMKGWHRHGVCTDELWPYRDEDGVVRFREPRPGWQDDAASRPLGAYYRVDKDSIADLQAAIFEVGAVYASAQAHPGWDRLADGEPLPFVRARRKRERAGGHAFALVGYTADGFIVQNSWGPRWGFSGFAILPYEEWTTHGMDVWVAVIGAAMRVAEASRTRSTFQLRERGAGMAAWSWTAADARARPGYDNPRVEPYSENRAYQLTVVLGNNGTPVNQFVDRAAASEAVAEVAHRLPAAWFASRPATERRRIALYAHGGINSEAKSIERIRVMAPYFLENGIYPLFLTWRTGVLESIAGRLEDALGELIGVPDRAAGKILDQIADARDRTIELAAENLLVKSLWTEMKQNARAAGGGDGGLQLLAARLADLSAATPGLEIHAIGHSAGSLLLGHLLPLLATPGLRLVSCRLYAPACTVGFAGRTYVPALAASTLGRLEIDVLSDAREQGDSVGPYGKSLLYLVSRALEDRHKTPLLGLEQAWIKAEQTREHWNEDTLAPLRAIVADLQKAGARLNVLSREWANTGRDRIRVVHGSFDNDVDIVTGTLCGILGRKTLPTAIESLAGF